MITDLTRPGFEVLFRSPLNSLFIKLNAWVDTEEEVLAEDRGKILMARCSDLGLDELPGYVYHTEFKDMDSRMFDTNFSYRWHNTRLLCGNYLRECIRYGIWLY